MYLVVRILLVLRRISWLVCPKADLKGIEETRSLWSEKERRDLSVSTEDWMCCELRQALGNQIWSIRDGRVLPGVREPWAGLVGLDGSVAPSV